MGGGGGTKNECVCVREEFGRGRVREGCCAPLQE